MDVCVRKEIYTYRIFSNKIKFMKNNNLTNKIINFKFYIINKSIEHIMYTNYLI